MTRSCKDLPIHSYFVAPSVRLLVMSEYATCLCNIQWECIDVSIWACKSNRLFICVREIKIRKSAWNLLKSLWLVMMHLQNWSYYWLDKKRTARTNDHGFYCVDNAWYIFCVSCRFISVLWSKTWSSSQ